MTASMGPTGIVVSKRTPPVGARWMTDAYGAKPMSKTGTPPTRCTSWKELIEIEVNT